MLLAALPPCRLAAQSDPRLVAAVRLAQDGQGDSARAQVKRILDATPAAQPLYAEAVYTSGVVAVSATERERQFQRVAVEFNGSPWSDDALLGLMQLNFARGDMTGVSRTAERLHSDYPQSEVIPEAALWAARAYFRQSDNSAGCRWLTDGLARADTLNIELRNGLTFLNGRCGGAAQRDTVPTAGPPDRPAAAWAVQVASSSTAALATEAVAKLARDGFPGGYVVPDGAAFKVRVGRSAERPEIDALLVRVRVKYPSAFVVTE